MDVGCTLDSRLDYRLRLWALTSASRAVSVVAELLVFKLESRTADKRCTGFSSWLFVGELQCSYTYLLIYCYR